MSLIRMLRLDMFHHFFAKERSTIASVFSKSAGSIYKEILAASGIEKLFHPDALLKSQKSVRVFANDQYIGKDNLPRLLTQTTSVSVAGDRDGFFQDGTSFPKSTDFFSTLKTGDHRGLSPVERLIAGKKIISSHSLVLASGGYPQDKPKFLYKKPFEVGIFSQAGAQFEMAYLHYALFGLDPFHSHIEAPLFAHLYEGLPTAFDEAKKTLGDYDSILDIGRIRTGFPFLARSETGEFYSSLFKRNAVIFLNKAYERHIYEDTALLLAAVNESALKAGKPAFLKATAVGMGFFGKVDCQYDIHHHLFPYFLRAYYDLLSSGHFPHIAKIEFPIFSSTDEDLYRDIFTKESYGGVCVQKTSRDVLAFNDEEREAYYVCVVNPSDSNALPGNEWGYTSVESMIANNTSLRLDQVHLINPQVLNSSNHIMVRVDKTNFTTELRAPETTLLPTSGCLSP